MMRLRSYIGILIPILFFIVLLLIFSIQRLVIRVFLPEFFVGSSFSQTITAMLVGLRFDANIAATIACPLIALLFAGNLFKRPAFQKSVSALIAVIISLIIFLSIADFYFFKQFGERLNHKAIIYLDSDYVYKIIWNDYPIIIIAMVFCLSGFLIFKGLTGILRRIKNEICPLPIANVVISSILLISLAVVGIRGTLGPKAINTGPAYFCSSSSVAQLTLNGLFTLREAAFSLKFRQESLDKHYTLLPPEQASKNTVALISQPRRHLVQHVCQSSPPNNRYGSAPP